VDAPGDRTALGPRREIVHILHTYDSYSGVAELGQRMPRDWLESADAAGSDMQPWVKELSRYDIAPRVTQVILRK
jgi:hypothetical protein